MSNAASCRHHCVFFDVPRVRARKGAIELLD
jgi:hypothetical protein